MYDIESDGSARPSGHHDAWATPLYYVVFCRLQCLVEQYPTDYPRHVHVIPVGGRHGTGTALHGASQPSHFTVILSLLGHGGDVDV
jgi:hypothetical protein